MPEKRESGSPVMAAGAGAQGVGEMRAEAMPAFGGTLGPWPASGCLRTQEVVLIGHNCWHHHFGFGVRLISCLVRSIR